MSNALEGITNAVLSFDRGHLAMEDVVGEVADVSSKSRSETDETLPEALDLLLDRNEWPYFLCAVVDGIRDGREGRFLHPLGQTDQFLPVLERVQGRILEALDDPQHRDEAVRAFTSMPEQMLAYGAFFERFFAKLTALDLTVTERLEVNRALYLTTSKYAGRIRTRLELVDPYMEEPAVLDLLVEMALHEGILPFGEVLTTIREGMEGLSTDQLVRLASLFAIEDEDEVALECTRLVLSREGVGVHDRYLMAFILWISGEEEEGMEVLAAWPHDPWAGGWHTSGRESLASYLRARDASPEEVIEILTTHPGGWARRATTAVGALSARFAYMRMKASLALGDNEWAGREAYAVMKYHDARVYSLHTQGRDQEFPGALVNRTAVTMDELREARKVFEANPFDTDRSMILAEGSVYFRDLRFPL